MRKRFQMTLAPILFLFFAFVLESKVKAGTDGALQGSVVDSQGVAVGNQKVELWNQKGDRRISTTVTSPTGEFRFFPVSFGTYSLVVAAPDFLVGRQTVSVAASNLSVVTLKLQPASSGAAGQAKEMLLEVHADKVQLTSDPTSSTRITQERILTLPMGQANQLPKVLAVTTPGLVSGPFGQMFFRGNHASIQYQIDGVQMPDSPSNTFGEVFSPRNIDRMEVITGGVPAEYGLRLSAVINILTRSGAEVGAGNAEVNYGSYNTINPIALYGGSNESGSLHYFVSTNYHQTERGLDTPNPSSTSSPFTGGYESSHNFSQSTTQFVKLDYFPSLNDKWTMVVFQNYHMFQIPTYPGTFSRSDPYFSGTGTTPNTYNYIYTPPGTNDNQIEDNAYAQVVWRHSYSEKSFLQIAPYYRASYIRFNNDYTNDLNAFLVAPALGTNPSTFTENRVTHNVGIKGDYHYRPNDNHFIKMGSQLQASKAMGSMSIAAVQSENPPASLVSFSNNDPTVFMFGSLYAQDDYRFAPGWSLMAGLRFDITQFQFSGQKPVEYALQPRIGLSKLWDQTKLHAFYGKLFQPAPAENLRVFFNNYYQTSGAYNIRAERDDYFEVGVEQGLPAQQAIKVNVYYKLAQNMLDDMALGQTAIVQPYNFAQGYAQGVEVSLKGEVLPHLSHYVNYSYDLAKGKGVSGGIFVFPPGEGPNNTVYQYLDHVQLHTLNSGLTFTLGHFYWTTNMLYGSGLRTGDNNSLSLPQHLTFDTTVGYTFTGNSWWSRFKVSADCLNITNNAYPITLLNGYNGSHFAPGRQFFVHLVKDL